jgi:hypothetical protein
MEIHVIGIDLGKTVFHLVGLNQKGGVVVRKKFSRPQLLRFTSNLPRARREHCRVHQQYSVLPKNFRGGSPVTARNSRMKWDWS